MTHTVTASKKAIRKQLAQVLSSLSQDQLLRQSTNVLRVLRSLEVFNNATTIGLYMNTDTSEIKTLPIISDVCSRTHSQLYLPHCAPLAPSDNQHYPGQSSKLIFYRLSTLEDVEALLPQGKYSIREPTSGDDVMDTTATGLDLVVLPAVAFNKDRFRLGHGAGFYDDFIKRHVAKFGRKPYLLGVGLREQLLESIPLEPHDERLDGVIVDDTFYGNDESL